MSQEHARRPGPFDDDDLDLTADEIAPFPYLSLLHYVELHAEGWWEDAIRRTVLAEMWRQRPTPTATELHTRITLYLGTGVQLSDIDSALHTLADTRQVIRAGGGKWRLTEEASRQIARDLSNQEELLERVASRYSDVLATALPSLLPGERNFDDLLRHYLVPLVRSVGASTWHLLLEGAPEGDLARVSLTRYLSTYPEELHGALRAAVTEFLDPQNSDVRQMVLRLITTYFLIAAPSVDRYEFEIALKELGIRHIEFVLDARILLLAILPALQDAPPTQEQRVVESLVLLKEGGSARFATTASLMTMHEVKADLQAAAVPQAQYARLWLSMSERSRSDMVRPFMVNQHHARVLIDGLRSLVTERGVGVRRGEPASSRMRSRDVDWEVQRALQLDHQGRKSRDEWTHDIELYISIEMAREEEAPSSVASAGTWLVTDDSELLGYDRHHSRDNQRLPICLHPTSALRLLQFFHPPSFEGSLGLVELVRYPILIAGRDSTTEIAIHNIADAMESYERSRLPAKATREALITAAVRERVDAQVGREDEIAEAYDRFSRAEASLAQVEDEVRGAIVEAAQAGDDEALRDTLHRLRDVTVAIVSDSQILNSGGNTTVTSKSGNVSASESTITGSFLRDSRGRIEVASTSVSPEVLSSLETLADAVAALAGQVSEGEAAAALDDLGSISAELSRTEVQSSRVARIMKNLEDVAHSAKEIGLPVAAALVHLKGLIGL